MNNKTVNEIKRCKADFFYFAENYLKIAPKRGKLVPLIPNKAQHMLFQQLETDQWLFILKARQLGNTTGIAAWLFWKALFTPLFRVAVLAQSGEAAKSVFSIYRRFYDNLPKFLQISTRKSNAHELAFIDKHGSYIKISSASSENLRGSTFNAVHVTEAAHYKDLNMAVEGVFNTVSDDGHIIIETTAKGLNEGYKFWIEENGFAKLFIPWTIDAGYQKDKLPRTIKTIDDSWLDYQRQYGLTSRQLNWALWCWKTKCRGSLASFNQEYPVSAELAFVTSGTPYFDKMFRHAPSSAEVTGLKVYGKPKDYHTYVMGVDTASGSPDGDYSAAVVIDITQLDTDTINDPTVSPDTFKGRCDVVATYYQRLDINKFAVDVYRLGRAYNAFIVCENNSYGLTVLHYLRDHGYPLLYRKPVLNSTTGRWTERLGFTTSRTTRPLLLSRLQEFINKDVLATRCPRLQSEINSFVYNDKGKAEANKGAHDDLVFAAGLALQALHQAPSFKMEAMQENKPTNMEEVLKWEMAHGLNFYDNAHHFFTDYDSNVNEDGFSLTELCQ